VTKKSWVPSVGLSHKRLVMDSQTRAELSRHWPEVLTSDRPAAVSEDTSRTALTATALTATDCRKEPQAMEATEPGCTSGEDATAGTTALSLVAAVGVKSNAWEKMKKSM
jgi:hypothetical protein